MPAAKPKTKPQPQPKPPSVKVNVKTVCAHCGSLLRGNSEKPELTDRQVRVLVLIAQGKMCSEIGEALGISTRTAEFHRMMLMQKLRLHSSAELALYAAGNGLI